MMTLLDQLSRNQPPRTEDGVWVSRDGSRALLLVRTRAAGSDTDGQQHAVEAIQGAFGTALANDRARAALVMSGPGVFAVQARTHIKSRGHSPFHHRLGARRRPPPAWSYRSLPALLLGLVPVVSGAIAGIAAVAFGFGVVQGVTLAFGVTLIGEGVDYSIYLFIQSRADSGPGAASGADWRRSVWPTIRLGMLTSVCGFAALLVSSFPGLAQLGLYSLTGVLAAGLVTRFVLPELLPRDFRIRDLTPIGRAAVRGLSKASAARIAVVLVAISAALVLGVYRPSAVEPRPLGSQPRARGGAKSRRAAAGRPRRARRTLPGGDFGTRRAVRARRSGARRRRASTHSSTATSSRGIRARLSTCPASRFSDNGSRVLPPPDVLRARLTQALSGLPLRQDRLEPFLHDVEAARTEHP